MDGLKTIVSFWDGLFVGAMLVSLRVEPPKKNQGPCFFVSQFLYNFSFPWNLGFATFLFELITSYQSGFPEAFGLQTSPKFPTNKSSKRTILMQL